MDKQLKSLEELLIALFGPTIEQAVSSSVEKHLSQLNPERSQDKTADGFSSRKDAMKKFGVSGPTFNNILNSGLVNRYRFPGSRLVYVKNSELEAALSITVTKG